MTSPLNRQSIPETSYGRFHAARFDATVELIRSYGAGRIVEVGGHPWAMTSRLLVEPRVTLQATVSAQEVTRWPDEIPVTVQNYKIDLGPQGRRVFRNFSANIERTLFAMDAEADIVLACEMIEHLARSPHIMLLNTNQWLKPGGLLILTTPNGTQLENPFRLRPKMPAYRPSIYSRHNYVYSMDGLRDLIECCGFEIVRADYWSPYRRRGPSNLYRSFFNLGPRYLKDKLAQTLCVVARKIASRSSASRLPKVYSPEEGWERVDHLEPAGHGKAQTVGPQPVQPEESYAAPR